MRRLLWLMALVAGLGAVAAAAAMSLQVVEQQSADGSSPPSIHAVLFFLGLLMVVIATIGNVALTAIDPRA